MNKILYLVLLGAVALTAQTVTINDSPSREFGHPKLPASSSPPLTFTSTKENYVEGREFSNPTSVAFDTSVSPPILYVADTLNNRVLAWRNSASISKGNFADKAIGQRDLFSTNGGGPGTSLTSGLFLPLSVAVDSKGNLYVLDGGNNRILRYPAPFNQSGDLLQVDLVIGQKSLSSGNQANEALPVSPKAFATYNGSLYSSQITFDAAGNLWMTDPLNNRVLRFPVGSLTAGTSEPPADLVIGQSDFLSTSLPSGFNQISKNALNQPSALAFDQAGRLYVADSIGRVLQYQAALSTGITASRVLGIAAGSAGTVTVYPSQYTIGNPGGASANGLFTIGNNLFVVDSQYHRILRYDEPQNWPIESPTALSPPALTIIGQNDFNSGKVNRGLAEPNGESFFNPTGAVVNGTNLWVADSGNNRVIALPQAGTQTFSAANRVLGQLDFNYRASNLVQGKELFLRTGNSIGGGVVIDNGPNHPPRLYVADTFNNRILGFADARKVGTDSRNILSTVADLVIGQPDLLHSGANYPKSDSTTPTATGLLSPNGLALDSSGNLYVADTGNGRIVRFPSPFNQAPGLLQTANLVLGQFGLTTKTTDASSSTMAAPYGVAVFSKDSGESIAASDLAHNRILVFKRSSGDFVNGQPASIVLGQSDFSSINSGTGPASLNAPRHIATDTSDRLYVMDPGNGRMVVFTRASSAGNGANSALQLPGLNTALGVAVSANTGEIWIANTNSNQILRFPEFQTLLLNTNVATAQLSAATPIALALDSFDNIIGLEGTNRMTFYYAKLTFQHAASFNQQPMSPGMLAYLYRLGKPFSLTSGKATAYPWPTSISDIQVQVNGVPATLFNIDGNQGRIDFQVPQNAPTSGTADFIVSRPSTGEIVAAATLPMGLATPGFFTTRADGTGGPIAALNAEDNNSVNSPTNQVGRGKVITLYLTGAGPFNNPVPDGSPRISANTTTQGSLAILMNPGGAIDASNVQYSGMADFPGGWQINVKIPETVPPSNSVTVVVLLNDQRSNLGPTSTINTTISVK